MSTRGHRDGARLHVIDMHGDLELLEQHLQVIERMIEHVRTRAAKIHHRRYLCLYDLRCAQNLDDGLPLDFGVNDDSVESEALGKAAGQLELAEAA